MKHSVCNLKLMRTDLDPGSWLPLVTFLHPEGEKGGADLEAQEEPQIQAAKAILQQISDR